MKLTLPRPDDLRIAAIGWIRRTLQDCVPVSDLPEVAGRAEAMQALCVAYDVPVERCVQWIIARPRNAEYGLIEWRRYCQEWQEAKISAQREAEARQDLSPYPD